MEADLNEREERFRRKSSTLGKDWRVNGSDSADAIPRKPDVSMSEPGFVAKMLATWNKR